MIRLNRFQGILLLCFCFFVGFAIFCFATIIPLSGGEKFLQSIYSMVLGIGIMFASLSFFFLHNIASWEASAYRRLRKRRKKQKKFTTENPL